MKIIDIEIEHKAFQLVKPYRITNQLIDKVANCIVRIKLENGVIGLGAGSPIDFVTGETMEGCLQALDVNNLSWLIKQSIYTLPSLTKTLKSTLQHTPAASAAIDIALHDAFGKLCNQPLVNILGRVHHALPTSITVGIKELDATLNEAMGYVNQGFKNLKIKLGENVEQDIATLHALKKQLPNNIKIRVDMNQGYTLSELQQFIRNTSQLDIELIEQPFNKMNNQDLSQFSDEIKNKIAADESVISVQDMFNLVRQKRQFGIVNIKLMKCGGISSALGIARLAELAEMDLMWGCMDESIISISAALHAALSSKKTKYLDLDGSFDLADDLVEGGFVLEDGYLRTIDRPGLGVELTCL